MLGIKIEDFVAPDQGIKLFLPPKENPSRTVPDTAGNSYSVSRKFRAAIPHLRFKSGVRFEFTNLFEKHEPKWRIKFFFGNSKNIIEFPLNDWLLREFKSVKMLNGILPWVLNAMTPVESIILSTDARTLQEVWIHSRNNKFHPYDIVDVIGQATEEVIALLMNKQGMSMQIVANLLAKNGNRLGSDKVLRHSQAVLAGLLVGSLTNILLTNDTFNKSS